LSINVYQELNPYKIYGGSRHHKAPFLPSILTQAAHKDYASDRQARKLAEFYINDRNIKVEMVKSGYTEI